MEEGAAAEGEQAVGAENVDDKLHPIITWIETRVDEEIKKRCPECSMGA